MDYPETDLGTFMRDAKDGDAETLSLSQNDAILLAEVGASITGDQRKPSLGHVVKLKAGMENGSAGVTFGTIHLVRLGDEVFLADGQHRMLAHAQINKVIRYTATMKCAEGDEDIRKTFRSLDTAARARSKGDRVMASISELIGASEITPKAMVQQCWTALEIIAVKTVNSPLLTTDRVIAAWNPLAAPIKVYVETLRKAAKPNVLRLRNANVIAPFLWLMTRDEPDTVAQFLYGVAAPVGDTWGEMVQTWLTQTADENQRKRNLTFASGERLSLRDATALVVFTAYHGQKRPVLANSFKPKELCKASNGGWPKGWQHDVKEGLISA